MAIKPDFSNFQKLKKVLIWFKRRRKLSNNRTRTAKYTVCESKTIYYHHSGKTIEGREFSTITSIMLEFEIMFYILEERKRSYRTTLHFVQSLTYLDTLSNHSLCHRHTYTNFLPHHQHHRYLVKTNRLVLKTHTHTHYT